jgi:hypothetical protein
VRVQYGEEGEFEETCGYEAWPRLPCCLSRSGNMGVLDGSGLWLWQVLRIVVVVW